MVFPLVPVIAIVLIFFVGSSNNFADIKASISLGFLADTKNILLYLFFNSFIFFLSNRKSYIIILALFSIAFSIYLCPSSLVPLIATNI